MSALLPVGEALDQILSRIEPLASERVSLLDAVDRVLAEPVVADRALPAHDDSAMDGYAVRSSDVPAPGLTLPVVGEVRAGEGGEAALAPGTAWRIFTGAPLPPGADAVIIQENARRDGDHVTFTEAATPGRNVRPRGSDLLPGRVLLEAGRPLRPGDVALLATLGRGWVPVVRRPVVALAASGDELVEPDGGPPRRGQVVNGNLYGLAAAVRALGAVPRLLPIIPDTAEATRAALAQAAEADALLTTGGMSVGEYDFIRDALRTLSGDRFGFWKVAIRPGKPIGFGHIGRCAVFGLPGNPVSALVTFEVFVRPALLRLMGHARVRRVPVGVVLERPLRAGGDREEYVRATVRADAHGALHVDTARPQGSGALSSVAGADALVIVPPGCPARDAGELAFALMLGPDDPAARLP